MLLSEGKNTFTFQLVLNVSMKALINVKFQIICLSVRWLLNIYTTNQERVKFVSNATSTVPPTCLCCQSKHQKHQAFEAELHANADRIRGVIDTGNALIQRGACAGSEDAVKVCYTSTVDQYIFSFCHTAHTTLSFWRWFLLCLTSKDSAG